MNAFAGQIDRVNRMCTAGLEGQVSDVVGLTVRAQGLPAPLGSLCALHRAGGIVEAQVVGFRDDEAVLMPLRDTLGVARGDRVTVMPCEATVACCDAMVGRVLNGLGNPIDNGPPLHAQVHYPLYRTAPEALQRPRIREPIGTGIRAIDAMLAVGRGQRMGLFAGTGVGKSVLIGMIARYTDADVVVVALVGERGREVNDFIEKDLGPQGRQKAVMVVSTSDQSPVLRVRAGFVATAVAEYFRDQGRNVLLLMDSVTRLAMAQRQIGLAAGEPPATKGYTPSVFGMMPQLMERAGRTEQGSITGFYSVLVEADDINDPVGDAVRGILDGHVWLSRSLAHQGHYPAISVNESISRVMVDIVPDAHVQAARAVQRVLATWAEIEDLVNIGAYAPGTNPWFDTVIEMRPAVQTFLQQAIDLRVTHKQAGDQLMSLASQIEQARQRRTASPRGAEAAARRAVAVK